MNKSALQRKIKNIITEGNILCLQWATGVGKSRAAINTVNQLISLKSKKLNFKVLILIAEKAHKQNWEEEIKKWKLKTTSYEIICYASMKNTIDAKWDAIIFDEAHHLASDKRLEYLSKLHFNTGILLSATLPDKLLIWIQTLTSKKIIQHKVNLKKAIDNKFLPKPKIILIPMGLDNTELSEEIILNWGKKEKRQKYECTYTDRYKYLNNKNIYKDVELHIKCTQQEKYNYIDNNCNYYKQLYNSSSTNYTKLLWLRAGSERKRFLGECKTEKVQKLLASFKGKRFLCFCSSIKQAELLGEADNTIHSKKSNSLEIIKDFNEGKINNLFTVGMLQEGQNLKNVEAGIIIQLDGKERAFLQKFGRTLRSKSPMQYILYYKDTQDVQYLNNVLSNVDEKYIEYQNIK